MSGDLRTDLARELAAIERLLDRTVMIVRVVIDADGHEIRRIHRGSFQAPPDWQPPKLENLIAIARGKKKGRHP